jgi:RNA methyltransferase, TrmH family
MSSPVSRDALRVMEDVRRVATAKGRATVKAFSVEGRRMLERGLRAQWSPRAVLVGSSLGSEPEAKVEAVLGLLGSLGCATHVVPDAQLLELSQGRRAGLLTALFDLPPGLPLSDLVARRPAPAVFLVLVDVEEPGNVGALIRTALACDAAGAICVGATDPFHPKAARTSLGSLFKLPLTHLPAGVDPVQALRAEGILLLAAVARQGRSIDRASWPSGSVAVLVGNEGQGLGEALRESADARVSIDLSTEADSFCVNAAAAICLYEVQRRLRLGP